MKSKYLLFVVVLLIMGNTSFSQSNDLIEGFLNKLDGIEFEKTPLDSLHPYSYTIFINQAIDHQNPQKGSFSQRLYLTHIHDSLPTVMVTEGYGARRNYISEPAKILQCNQIIVEHRYFGESVPDSMDWSQLTTANAAADHHHIYTIFSEFYSDKWICTGISKGGQTSNFYKYYYPNDMHISIPYVAPLNLEQEDVRINWFLRHVGSSEENAIILNYQKMMLQNFDSLFPIFTGMAEMNQQVFAINDTAAYEFMVLEFPYSFFQWGSLSIDSIPREMLSPYKMMRPMMKLGLVSFYFKPNMDKLIPFMVQAYRELGYYDYDMDLLGNDLRKVKNSSNIAFLPEELRFEYDTEIMNKVYDYIHNHGNRMIFIYGELDPWSSTSVNPDSRTDAIKMVLSGGAHSTRIRHFSEEEQLMIKLQLLKWLNDE